MKLTEKHIGQMIEVRHNQQGEWYEREFLGWRGDSICTRSDTNKTKIVVWNHGRPIQTEAEKFLEKFGYKKICDKGMWKENYYTVTGVMDHNRVYIKDQNGKGGHIVLKVSDNWQLWEEPKVELDTRRVAGWWYTRGTRDVLMLVSMVDPKGIKFSTGIGDGYKYADEENDCVFSKDPMKPLDQWQTLKEVCES